MLLVYIRARDVDAYTAQGWLCWRLTGHHGARDTSCRTFLAVYE